MSSVTGRISEIRQPRGGYLKLSEFEIIEYDDGIDLFDEENIPASIIGIVVDYMTRYMMGADKEDAFDISLQGAALARKAHVAKKLIKKISGIDEASIINACKLVTFDVFKRSPANAELRYKDTNPDKKTIDNIQILIERSIRFFEKSGPIIRDGFTFEALDGGRYDWGGYTKTVDTGDGDFLTTDTLWDFKVSKAKPTSKNTLQILMYWIMGQHSRQAVYKNIRFIGIYNPRLNTAYKMDINEVSDEVIEDVERDVICYEG